MHNISLVLDASTAALAGSIAWWIFRQLRMLFPLPATPPQSPFVRYLYTWLYVDEQAYLAVGAIAFIVTIAIVFCSNLLTNAEIDWKTAMLGAWSVATWVHHHTKKKGLYHESA